MTPPQKRALEILASRGPLRPTEFARWMWPDSPGWTRVSNCGTSNTGRHGSGMPRVATKLLRRLVALGWARERQQEHKGPRGGYEWSYPEFALTYQGRAMLEEAREELT